MQEKSGNTELENLWAKGEISSEEFLTKMEGKTESAFQKALLLSSDFVIPSSQKSNHAWDSILEKIEEKNTPTIPLYRKYWVSIAASLALAIGAFFILNQKANQMKTIETATAEFQSVYLPDSSIVYMNAESEVSFSETSWNESREVKLKGEAFFEVKKGSDFTVQTLLGNVSVLGTSFNVKARNELYVACKTGKVRVTSPNNQFVDITPGMAVRLKTQNNFEGPYEVNLSEIDQWRTGEFYFESVMFSEVLEELKRQFNVEVEFDTSNFEDRPYTTYFNSKNLTEALQLACKPIGLSFEIKDQKVTIKNPDAQ